MKQKLLVKGFSKLSAEAKLHWLEEQEILSPAGIEVLNLHRHTDPALREIYTRFSENTIGEFHLPYGLAPNFLINGKLFTIPMVVEESSVVAASAHAARFWATHGGFLCEVRQKLKSGQVHFRWEGDPEHLKQLFRTHKKELLDSVKEQTCSMEARGGGIISMDLIPTSPSLAGLYQLFLKFHTADAMGANFINSVLETVADRWQAIAMDKGHDRKMQIIMAILSNHVPECLVHCHVEAPVQALDELKTGLPAEILAHKFVIASDIAREDPFRAVTHNKGIMNGVDAVVMATGNDYRAVEAAVHAYAARDGQYRGLSSASLTEGIFRFEMELPLALGTVGGLTASHPQAAVSLEMLGHPDATQLMHVAAAAGLANNFSAIRSLVSSGIQKGHMKLHLENILLSLEASPGESRKVKEHFKERAISYSGVKNFLVKYRKNTRP